MARASRIRAWQWAHRWSSLVCTLFVLLLCLTGLPLIFMHEILPYLEDDPRPALREMPADTPRLGLDAIVRSALAQAPGMAIEFVFGIDGDEPRIEVALGVPEPPAADGADGQGAARDAGADAALAAQHAQAPREADLQFDARTGELVWDSRSQPEEEHGLNFINIMAGLHLSLMAGLPGALLLGAMGVLFVVALVSGIVLYAPFMQKLPFGAVRAGRGPRVRWLDLHNLLGIATALWMLVVGATGAAHTLADLLSDNWEDGTTAAAIAANRGRPVPPPQSYVSLDAAVAAARRAIGPDRMIVSALYPGRSPVGPYHYFFWTKGRTPLTGRIFAPVLVDVQSAEVTSARPFPWYLRMLYVMQPLHFGDYGGMPLKAIWAVLDLVAIVVVGSGLYLWLGRRRAPPAVAGVPAA